MPASASQTSSPQHTLQLGCVSYLNAKPLIEGLDLPIHFDVPAKLLSALQADETQLALCPIVDAWQSEEPLRIIPIGGIGCEGPTLTVRLFSKVPLHEISAIHVDLDSHTSVALLRVLMQAYSNQQLAYLPLNQIDKEHQAMLLIGDKVITSQLGKDDYPFQLDLGEAWLEQTGLPFVFATWMAKQETDLGDLPDQLARQLQINLTRCDAIAQHYAPKHHWPVELAQQYLSQIMRYQIGTRQLQAINLFQQKCQALNLLKHSTAIES